MGLLKNILIVIVAILLIIWIVSWFSGGSSQLTPLSDGTEMQKISPSDLPSNDNSNNYTYSVWFYVQDWNYRYGEPKIILGRVDENKAPSPSITLGALENNLQIKVVCYGKDASTGVSQNDELIHTCDVRNVPLQKWVNVITSLYGRSLDVYIDGKLVRTCVLPGVAKVNPDSPIYITPQGGFSGWTSNIRYWSEAKNPQQAYNIYKAGYGGSTLGNLFNKYRIKISYLKDNVEQASFEI